MAGGLGRAVVLAKYNEYEPDVVMIGMDVARFSIYSQYTHQAYMGPVPLINLRRVL